MCERQSNIKIVSLFVYYLYRTLKNIIVKLTGVIALYISTVRKYFKYASKIYYIIY